jgi:4-hydroxybenzoate polyprenyltransferase
MTHITWYIKLIRINQWYKNVVIFLPIFFAGKLFELVSLEKIIIGFVALCLISSTNYILNDIIDLKKDKLHPEKKYRPLAYGKVTIYEAYIISILFLIASIIIAYYLNIVFLILIVILFILTTLYTIWLKNEPLVDILLIAINFVIRAISGAFILSIFVSPWLIVCPFFLALFLASSKRNGDLRLLKKMAITHKKVLKYYTLQTTNALMIMSTTCFIIAYSIYAFSRTELLLITLPFAVYFLYRYYFLVSIGSEIARNPQKAYKDKKLIISAILWSILTFIIFYYLII